MRLTDSFTPRMLRSVKNDDPLDLDRDLHPLHRVEPCADVALGGHVHRRRAEEVARDHAEDGVAARGDRRRDGEDVVDEERAPADDTELLAEELRGDDVASSARRKVLDDSRVGVGDDEDGERRADGEADRERGVVALLRELAKGFVWPVGRGGEPVRSEPDPGEHGDEREAVEGVCVVDVLRRAEEQRG